jgi:hypothetical protein
MAVEAGLSSAPIGLAGPRLLEQPVGEASVEVLEGGDVEVTFGEPEATENTAEPVSFDANLAEHLEDADLALVAKDVLDRFTADLSSRHEWEQTFTKGFDLLGLKLTELNDPFEGACSATHPLIIESAVKFQSKASQELFPAGGPV